MNQSARSRVANSTASRWRHSLAGDTALAAALLDRLLHHAYVVPIQGDSYRRRDKRRADLMDKVKT